MAASTHAGSKYGQLNAEVIVKAARNIADADGLAALTFRRIADALGAGPASIYRHITSRDELLALLADDLAAGFPRSRGPATLDTVLRQWQSVHRYLLAHSWGAQVIAAGEQVSLTGEDFAQHAIDQLEQLGLAPMVARRTYDALWNLLLGHLLNRHPLAHGHAPVPDRDARTDYTWAARRLIAGSLTDP